MSSSQATRGIRQGCPLSPYQFVFAINELNYLREKKIKICGVYVARLAGIGVLAHLGVEFGHRPNSTENFDQYMFFSVPSEKCEILDFLVKFRQTCP
jgi:hypothetical protein